MSEPRVFTVSEVTREIKRSLGALGERWVKGEVSGFKAHANGHWYFTLKDEAAQLDAVMWSRDLRPDAVHLSGGAAVLRDGLLVEARGALTVYEARGRYQLRVLEIKESGMGALQEAFERLKEKLKKEGLFDRVKRPLPLLPRGIAVVTSASGAAIRDILNILGRRFPNLRISIFNVPVQGKGAEILIAEAVEEANRRNASGAARFDAMIVGRGGGSIEDLWPFNEEILARAIARSAIPVISAVGHETDFTICDFVADLRAPTPSAAAELLVGRKEDFERDLLARDRELRLRMEGARLRARQRLADGRGRLFRFQPANLIRLRRRDLDILRRDLLARLDEAARERRQRLEEAGTRLIEALRRRREGWGRQLERLHAQLNALGPESVLRRGFSMTFLADGRLLRAPDEAPPGARLRTRLHAGEVTSIATSGANPPPRTAAARRGAASDPNQTTLSL